MTIDGPLEVVDYDPNWATMFEHERHRIDQALGPLLHDIEHVGSTSIPGLAAKPIIDMQLVVLTFNGLPRCIEQMTKLGYTYLGTYGIEGREYFKRLGFHAHMVQINNDEFSRKRLFLEHLRTHPDARAEYAALKRHLADKWAAHPDALQRYNLGKTDFIMGALTAAGWDPERRPQYLKDSTNAIH
ncbi:hypothetical protein IWW55_000461 [Coemansia sp. RSA 2706]|nr:hypothetical protein IWW55_000461 [Coemansia sp. RSA 2706]KAJ2314645.1 hypothetical protein IWW54_000796 [Coemansia sp. RSA 2705]KAJ2326814.1 hypothetical protein IWW51_002082 [Coemansia sp. RSA 2702]KAJ2389299.1 hypothetical protein H4S02_002437 [Coemansia sp. RSA 2611]KAJ2739639.1 hypothetical protein H4R23_000319 [Coemansia sp. Cherry 401B]